MAEVTLRFIASGYANVPGGYTVLGAETAPLDPYWANRDTSYALPEGYAVCALISGELAIRDPDGEVCRIASSETGNRGSEPLLVSSRIVRMRRVAP